jgi:hypothetical protein
MSAGPAGEDQSVRGCRHRHRLGQSAQQRRCRPRTGQETAGRGCPACVSGRAVREVKRVIVIAAPRALAILTPGEFAIFRLDEDGYRARMRTSGGLEIGFCTWSKRRIWSAPDASPTASSGRHQLRTGVSSPPAKSPLCDSPTTACSVPRILNSNKPEYLLPTATLAN